MKYSFYGEQIPKEQRGELNEKVLYLIDSGTAEANGITQEDMYNAYTGDGGLHGLDRKDFDNYHAYSEAKKEAEKEAAQSQDDAAAELSDDPFIRQIQEKIALRAAAKKAKNYAEADAIRSELEKAGVILTDTAKGTTFTIKQ